MDPYVAEQGDTFPLDSIPAEKVDDVRNKLRRRGLSLMKRADEWYVGKAK